MKGLATRCVSKSKRTWYIQSQNKYDNWVTIGIVHEESPNRYRWVYSGKQGKESGLNHAHNTVNEMYVTDLVIRRIEH